MPNKLPAVQKLAVMLQGSPAKPRIVSSRLAPSAIYDVEYRTAIIALVFERFAKPKATSGQRSISHQRLKLLQFILEPALVLVAGIVLQDLFIAQPDLALYLKLASLALFIKSVISRFRVWEYLRKIFDMRNAAPIIAKLVDNQATEEDLAPIHLASFPKNIPPDIRQAAATQIARSYSPENTNP